jgi:hypothetical protein
MNYLKSNLNNSKKLPYDVMDLIYEYADPLHKIRLQIEKKEYDLDEIMYKRMKNEIKNRLKNIYQDYLVIYNDTYFSITLNNFDNILYRNALIYGRCGYKDFYLWKHKRPTNVCGLEHWGRQDYKI